jgi:hypothetical protein
VAAVVAVVAVGAAVVEDKVAAGAACLTTGRFSSFLANPWILKARPFMLGSLYT